MFLYLLSPSSLFLPPTTKKRAKMSAGLVTSVAGSVGYVGLKLDTSAKLLAGRSYVGWRPRTVTNGSRISCMKTWNPFSNKKYEALSYLPPLTEESIAKEVDYMLSKGWVPCLEFDEVGEVHRTNSRMPGYYDGRYWTLWKLPMFGCTDSSQVLREIVRLLSFDNKHQCQCMSFVIQRPTSSNKA